jgi:LmbE family N-acetylglucosaminyl deacetylase
MNILAFGAHPDDVEIHCATLRPGIPSSLR